MSLTTENDWGVITAKLDGVLVRDGERLAITFPTESSIPTVTLDVHGHLLTVDLYALRSLPICRR